MDYYGFIAILAAALAIWAMVTVAQSSLNGSQKVIWFFIVILFPIVGPITYYFMKVR